MTDHNPREVLERYVELDEPPGVGEASRRSSIPTTFEEYPQSGERIQGIAERGRGARSSIR